MNHEKNDLRVIDGKVVQEAAAAAIENNVVLLNDDTTRVQLMVARILKSIGKRVKTRVTLGALSVVVAKVFTVIPQEKHAEALQDFIKLVALAIHNEYTPEEREKARLMALSALKAQAESDAKAGQPTES